MHTIATMLIFLQLILYNSYVRYKLWRKVKHETGIGRGNGGGRSFFNIVVKETFQREHNNRIKTMLMPVGGHVEAGGTASRGRNMPGTPGGQCGARGTWGR